MALLSDLVADLAQVSFLPEATVFAYGRFAREAGHISQKGRGRGAASMSVRDAANLLIAVAGTAVTREAGTAIDTFRGLKGEFFAAPDQASLQVIKWLKPLGWEVRRDRHGALDGKQKGDFGDFLEYMIQMALGPELNQFLRAIPVVDAASITEPYRNQPDTPSEILVKYGARLKAPREIEIGVDIAIRFKFDRLYPQVTVEVFRPNVLYAAPLFMLTFSPPQTDYIEGYFHTTAEFGEVCVAMLGATLTGKKIPGKIKNYRQFMHFLFPPPAAAEKS